MRTKYKKWAVDYITESTFYNDIIDSKHSFFNSHLEMEIGSGKGDFLIGLAKRNPNFNYIGVEKVLTVAGMFAKKIEAEQIKNLIIYPYDIITLFSNMNDNCIDCLYLNFSDPWPKERHAKRRLTYIKFLNEYYRLLKPNSFIKIKTDNDSLYEFTLEEIKSSKFILVSSEYDYVFDNENDSMSEYERKFREKGQTIHKIVLKKE